MDDLTGDNVEAMYEMTYETWTAARCAVRLPEDEYHYVDASGNRTTKGNAAGRLAKHKITHPWWILHGDEVGTVMYQNDDGPIGGQLYLTINGQWVKLQGTKSHYRFTLMCLTSGTGDAVMLIIIYAAKELDFVARFGYDHRAEEPFDRDVEVDKQVGEGKAFPGSPYCEYRGKRIPAVVAVSPKGSMTSEILATALDRLDELDVFPRTSGGPIPCVLFDAHDTRLQFHI